MLRSAAQAYGGQVVGVVLSGLGRDAAEGCRAVRDAGGTVVVQDPATSDFPSMPAAAIATGGAHVVLPPKRIAAAIAELLAGGPRKSGAAPATATSILLVDDQRIIREGLRALPQSESDFAVVAEAEAEDGRGALRLEAELRPDVVVMDIGLPDLDGIAVTRRIVAGGSRARVVALSALSDTETVRQTLEAGAAAYLDKCGAFEELVTVIRRVVAGRELVGHHT